jgi:hypothetical protein
MHNELPTVLTRRDAIEWICMALGVRRPKDVPAKRRILEAMTTPQVEKECNLFFGPLFLTPLHFTVIEGEHQLYPLPTKEVREAARLRCRGPNASENLRPRTTPEP